jgi:hypothetical protein
VASGHPNWPIRQKIFFSLSIRAKLTALKYLEIVLWEPAYPASLERRKIYIALRDLETERHGLLRIVDESGEDYLYPKALFREIILPAAVRRAVLAAA